MTALAPNVRIATHYLIHPDQLRLHNGYANCGACGLSFDVQTALVAASAASNAILPRSPTRRTDYLYNNAVAQIDAIRSLLMRPSGKMMQAREHTK